MSTWPPKPGEPPHPQIRAFLDDIADHPEDAGVRLIFADWLEDQGDPRAALLRMQAERLDPDRDTPDLEDRVRCWLDAHGAVWFGELPPKGSGYSLSISSGLLEVMGYLSSTFTDDPNLDGLRQALREGWFGHFHLTFWKHEQIIRASKAGILDGPFKLKWHGGDFRDDTLAVLTGLPRVRRLNVGGASTGVTDEGLRHLTTMPNLKLLQLWSLDQLTGSGLSYLAGLEALRELWLTSSPCVGDAAVFAMMRLPRLGEIYLELSSAVTTAGLETLANLPALRGLWFGSCELNPGPLSRLTSLCCLELKEKSFVDDCTLASLSSLVNLSSLDLSRCRNFTDAGLASLAGLARLEHLYLYQCGQITGAGVAHLAGLTSLKVLDLRGCTLKPHETRALRKALPQCDVLRQ